MKKPILFLFFIALLIHSGIIYSQWEPFYDKKNSANALQMMNLKGKVKSLSQTSYKAIDNAGVIIKGEEESDGVGIGLRYNNPNINSYYKMQFDTAGRAIKEIYYHGSITDVTLVHTYKNAAHIEIINKSEVPGKTVCTYTYKYNDQGKVIEQKIVNFFHDNTEFEQKLVYKYNEKMFLSESERFILKGGKYVSDGKGVYVCDSYGNTIKEAASIENASMSPDEFKYDDKNNLIERTYYISSGKVVDHKFIYKYDINKNVIQKDLYQPGKPLKFFSSKYEYDKTGNWVKRTDFIDKKATYILERKLEYY